MDSGQGTSGSLFSDHAERHFVQGGSHPGGVRTMRPVRSLNQPLYVARRGLVAALVLFVALGFLCGGSCYVSSCTGDCCHHHHHHGRCDGDDPPPPGPGWEGGWALEGFALVGATMPGFHPIAAVVPAAGPAILRPVMDPVGPDPAATAFDFTQRVLRANPAFFDLPDWAGALCPASVSPTADGGLTVTWSQVRRGAFVVPARGVVFHLDARGRIAWIENGTRVVPGRF